MRITNINIPKSEIKNGLEKVEMDRLGQVVLLAGKNGSGKSRLFDLIEQIIKSKPKKSLIDKSTLRIAEDDKSLKEIDQKIEMYAETIEVTTNIVQKKNYQKTKETLEHNREITLRNISNFQKILDWELIETDEYYEDYTIIHFIPKNLNIRDCITVNKAQIKSFAENIESVGVDSLADGTFAKIQTTQDKWFNTSHHKSTVSNEKKREAEKDYRNLKKLIKVFLNTNLDRDENGSPTIFGFPLGQANLSEGQKVLIQICLAIHCQHKSLDDIILFLDEPENHLHPSAIIETIKRIISHTKNGQIWIATHSIPLLSYFDPSSLWFMDANKVSFAGTIPEKVLNSLLGDNDQISKLQDFISLPGVLALNRHAFESLFRPVSKKTDKDDPQTLQIRKEIGKHLSDKKRIRILDYGTGKGRLLSNIIESSSEPISKIHKWLDYVAFDKFNDDSDECRVALKRLYSNWNSRYFNDISDLFGIYDPGSFDVVVMCNVLHEIDPKEWLSLFSRHGDVPKLLNEKGILLLVEDQEMLIGEKAYQKGFIVLNTQEIKDLFCISEKDGDFGIEDARGDGRLKAHRISKEYLTRITQASRIKALKSLHTTASKKILAIRNEEINYINGKKHGFWIQQFANTEFALDELVGKK